MKTMYLSMALVAILACGCTGNSSNVNNSVSATDSDATVSDSAVVDNHRRTVNDTITELPYDIPAQRFDETAQALFHATGLSCQTDLSKTGSVKVNAVKGKISVLEAVKMAIDGTSLKIKEYNDSVVVVE